MTAKTRKHLIAVLRLVVCTAALAWVLNHVTYHDYVTLADGRRLRIESMAADSVTVLRADGISEVIPCGPGGCTESSALAIEYGLKSTWNNADKPRLLLCLAIFAPVSLIQSKRFQIMLRAQEIEISYFESAKLSYAGNFLNFITALGSTGGDVFKMYYVSLHTDRKTEAVTTVLLDRFVGLAGLILMTFGFLAFRMGDGRLSIIAYGLGAMVLIGVGGGVIFFSRRLRAWVRPERFLRYLPFFDQLKKAESATRRLAAHLKLVSAAVGLTVLLQLIAMTSFVVAATALGLRSDVAAIWDYFAYFPGGMVIAAVPISFQGLGTMEAFFKHVMLGTHGSLPAILCLSMTIRLIGLFWALPGVIVTMTGSYRPRITEEEIRFA